MQIWPESGLNLANFCKVKTLKIAGNLKIVAKPQKSKILKGLGSLNNPRDLPRKVIKILRNS